jgi:hypothetical protein
MALTDHEFTKMMGEFLSAGQWMLDQLAMKRGAQNDVAPTHPSAVASQSAEDNHQALDDNQSLAQPLTRR